MSYHALTEDQVKEYALNLPNLFPTDAHLTSREIGDGNLNLVFHLQDQTSGKSVIFKQALPYARVVGESWPLTLDRARIESEALIKQRELCPTLVPEVYHYDADLALTIMEDLSDHVILRKGLTDGNQYPLLAEDIGIFLARTLFYQSDFYLAPDEKKSLVSQFINPELCKITEDLVFTDPYYDAQTNSFNPLIQKEVHNIWENHELKKEIAQLKFKFLTSAETLIHGDLHTGSIFVTEKSTKVIDPEFAYYGPMGFDIGAVLANLILNYTAQEAHIKNKKDRDAFQAYLFETMDTTWETFENEFRRLSKEESNDLSLKDPLFVDQFLLQVKQDALGFAGCKVLRRVIGLASVADLESIADPELRAQSERMALYIGRQLLLQRNLWSTADSLSTNIIASLNQREEKVS
jgi:5-methylthioribose kinase